MPDTENAPGTIALYPAGGECDAALAIDPGKQTGVAWTDGDALVTGTSDFWEVWNALASMTPSVCLDAPAPAFSDASTVCVILEALYKSRQSMGRKPAIAYNSGGVAREAELLAEWIGQTSYGLVEHDPAQQNRKWDSDFTRCVVGDWDGPDNSHTRDAIRLLFFYNFL